MPVPSQDKWEGCSCSRKDIRRKDWGDDAGDVWLISPQSLVAPDRIVGVPASVTFPFTIKCRRSMEIETVKVKYSVIKYT